MIAILTAAIISANMHWIVAGCVIVLCALISMEAVERHKDKRAMRELHERELAWRADKQDYDYQMYGDVEGEYPCETMPLTREQRAWYDYDDGMEEWR